MRRDIFKGSLFKAMAVVAVVSAAFADALDVFHPTEDNEGGSSIYLPEASAKTRGQIRERDLGVKKTKKMKNKKTKYSKKNTSAAPSVEQSENPTAAPYEITLNFQKKNGAVKQVLVMSDDKRLNLIAKNLVVVPSEIGLLTSLQKLYLDDNKIEVIPSEIGLLTSLKELVLELNLVKTLPSEIGLLTALEEFFFNWNMITAVPPEIGRLTSLERLHLNNNEIEIIPSEIGLLTSLEELFLAVNDIEVIPSEIGLLTSLEILWVDDTVEVPFEI